VNNELKDRIELLLGAFVEYTNLLSRHCTHHGSEDDINAGMIAIVLRELSDEVTKDLFQS